MYQTVGRPAISVLGRFCDPLAPHNRSSEVTIFRACGAFNAQSSPCVVIFSGLRHLQHASATQPKLCHTASKTAHIREPRKYLYMYIHLNSLLLGATFQTVEVCSRGRVRTKSALPWTRTQNPAERLHLVIPSRHPSLTWSASPRSPAAIYRNLPAGVNFSDYTDLIHMESTGKSKIFNFGGKKSLSKGINNYVISRAKNQTDLALLNNPMNKIKVHINVLHARVVLMILKSSPMRLQS